MVAAPFGMPIVGRLAASKPVSAGRCGRVISANGLLIPDRLSASNTKQCIGVYTGCQQAISTSIDNVCALPDSYASG